MGRYARRDIIDQIRIVFADVPALAADMLERVIERQPDMVVVGRLPSLAGLLDLAQMTRRTSSWSASMSLG
jgi:hypothetical protein